MVGAVTWGIGSVLLLTGAFAVGGVLHRVFVEGSLVATSPAAVGGVALGVVLILAGRHLEGGRPTPPSDDGGDEDESEDDLEGRERDDDHTG